MRTYADIPWRFNLATYFVDRNLHEGRGDRVALWCAGQPTTYAELAQLVNRAGHVLREVGVRPEERVLLACNDSVQFVALWWATIKIGAVVAEAYPFLPAQDIEYYLNYSRATAVITDDSTRDKVRSVRERCSGLRCSLVLGEAATDLEAGEVHFEALAAHAQVELDAADTTRDDIAIWKFTSGTTGQPKAAVHLQHDPLVCFWSYAVEVIGLRSSDVVLPVPKMFFGYARDLTTLFTFGVGATGIVFPERSTPEKLFELIARHRPTILVGVPTTINAMAEHPLARAQDLSSLRLCTSSGEALPFEVYEKWRRAFGVEICEGVGSSEMYHVYLSSRPGQGRSGSAGQAVPGYRIGIVDEVGTPLDDGLPGELWVSGESAAVMYWNDHEKSKRTFEGDRVRTGDVFRRDADGYFWYEGRIDDMLKVGGIWVAPLEVETCLLQHPAVIECAVVPYESDRLVLPRAHVVLREGYAPSAELEAVLQAHVRSRLSPHKYPRSVWFAAELPKTPNGKVDRKALRAEASTAVSHGG